MMTSHVLVNVFTATILFFNDAVFYRSDALQSVTLTRVSGDFSILDDNGERVEVMALQDQEGILYWYRRIKTPVCQSGECKLVDVGLYWDVAGDFFGIAVYGEHLTKTDHSTFSGKDYDRLLSVLQNDWSILREYEFSDLTNERPDIDGKADVDATSGATRKEIASETVENAVYTTYTLWHLVHIGEKEQLMALSADQLNRSTLMDNLLATEKKMYAYFLLDLFAQGKLNQGKHITSLIMQGLGGQDDPQLQNLAVMAVGKMDMNDPEIQSGIALLYPQLGAGTRLQILGAIKDLNRIEKSFYSVLENDLDINNEWSAVKILHLLTKASTQSQAVVEAARKLSESDNPRIKESAQEFLDRMR